MLSTVCLIIRFMNGYLLLLAYDPSKLAEIKLLCVKQKYNLLQHYLSK